MQQGKLHAQHTTFADLEQRSSEPLFLKIRCKRGHPSMVDGKYMAKMKISI